MATRLSGPPAPRRSRRRRPRARPVQARSLATVEAILAAAAQVFEARGFAAGTTNRIAERAGVSIGTLYQYYSDKHAIAHALAARHVAGMLARVNAWAADLATAEPGLHGALRSLVETALAAHEDQPRLHEVLLEEAPLPSGVRELVRGAEQEAGRTVADVLRQHREVRRGDVTRAGLVVVRMTTDLTHRFASHPDGTGRAAFVSEATDVLVAYVRSPDGVGG